MDDNTDDTTNNNKGFHDPNDPDVFTNPNKVALLDPRQQLIAFINMAKTGHLVNGDHMMTLEIILMEAGYDIDVNGELSSEERLALQHFSEALADKQMVNAMNMFVETHAKDLPLPKAAPPQSPIKTQWTRSVLQGFVAENKGFLKSPRGGKLISDPD